MLILVQPSLPPEWVWTDLPKSPKRPTPAWYQNQLIVRLFAIVSYADFPQPPCTPDFARKCESCYKIPDSSITQQPHWSHRTKLEIMWNQSHNRQIIRKLLRAHCTTIRFARLCQLKTLCPWRIWCRSLCEKKSTLELPGVKMTNHRDSNGPGIFRTEAIKQDTLQHAQPIALRRQGRQPHRQQLRNQQQHRQNRYRVPTRQEALGKRRTGLIPRRVPPLFPLHKEVIKQPPVPAGSQENQMDRNHIGEPDAVGDFRQKIGQITARSKIVQLCR